MVKQGCQNMLEGWELTSYIRATGSIQGTNGNSSGLVPWLRSSMTHGCKSRW